LHHRHRRCRKQSGTKLLWPRRHCCSFGREGDDLGAQVLTFAPVFCALSRARTLKTLFFLLRLLFLLFFCSRSPSHNVGKPKSLLEIHHSVVIFADLKQDFRVQPKDVNPASGDTAIMECDPPKGHPEPSVAWHKNGQAMPADSKKR